MENATRTADTPEVKQMKLLRLQTILIACLLAVVLAAGIFLAVQFASIRSCVDMIELNLQSLDAAAFNRAADSFTSAADQFSSIDMDKLNETVEYLQSAADNLGNVDINKLNNAVASLREAADTFKGIDVEALNSLVQALETVSSKLEAAVSAITGIFSR